jgi:hypothetical protein
MKITSLNLLINQLNANYLTSAVIVGGLTGWIDFAKVWIAPYREQISGQDVFLLKLPGSGYVGAVQVLPDDLHAHILCQHRGKGLLTRALKETILPCLSQIGRKRQRITVEDPRIAQWLQRRFGFELFEIVRTGADRITLTGDISRYKITKLSFTASEDTRGIRINRRKAKLSESDKKIIIDQLAEAKALMAMSQERLYMSAGIKGTTLTHVQNWADKFSSLLQQNL